MARRREGPSRRLAPLAALAGLLACGPGHALLGAKAAEAAARSAEICAAVRGAGRAGRAAGTRT